VNTIVEPSSIAAPVAAYALAVLSTAPGQILHTAGIVPTRPDGSVPDDLAEQADTVWHSIGALLAEAGMSMAHVVSVTTYVVQGNDLAVVMAARDVAMAGHRAASTLVLVPALARAEWRVEIAVVAAAS
jgi:2-iminobutanoate/2-iminopropanoate deaminase